MGFDQLKPAGLRPLGLLEPVPRREEPIVAGPVGLSVVVGPSHVGDVLKMTLLTIFYFEDETFH